MIFPDEEHSFLDAEKDLRSQMVLYIKKHFADILGDDVKLLDRPDGLALIAEKYGLHADDDAEDLKAAA